MLVALKRNALFHPSDEPEDENFFNKCCNSLKNNNLPPPLFPLDYDLLAPLKGWMIASLMRGDSFAAGWAAVCTALCPQCHIPWGPVSAASHWCKGRALGRSWSAAWWESKMPVLAAGPKCLGKTTVPRGRTAEIAEAAG